MIKYNIRYRGPFEYEKLILMILQFSNDVKNLKSSVETNELMLLHEKSSRFSTMFEKLTGEKGLTNKLLLMNMKAS